MTTAEEPLPASRIEAAKNKLVKAVARLERALEERPRRTGPESFDSVTAAVAARLDDAIERLKAVLER
ncbi:MAG: hypothetical protein ACE5JZ_04845 [Kiloniellales bacterium]